MAVTKEFEKGRPIFRVIGTTKHWTTTAANAEMQPIHDRMPVILPPDAWNPWLDPKIDTHAAVADLLGPCDDNFLQRWQIGSFVNKVTNDGPECIERLADTKLF